MLIGKIDILLIFGSPNFYCNLQWMRNSDRSQEIINWTLKKIVSLELAAAGFCAGTWTMQVQSTVSQGQQSWAKLYYYLGKTYLIIRQDQLDFDVLSIAFLKTKGGICFDAGVHNLRRFDRMRPLITIYSAEQM